MRCLRAAMRMVGVELLVALAKSLDLGAFAGVEVATEPPKHLPVGDAVILQKQRPRAGNGALELLNRDERNRTELELGQASVHVLCNEEIPLVLRHLRETLPISRQGMRSDQTQPYYESAEHRLQGSTFFTGELSRTVLTRHAQSFADRTPCADSERRTRGLRSRRRHARCAVYSGGAVMRAIIYAVQVMIGTLLGALLGRGASTAIGAASSPSCWRGCCAVLVIVVVGMAIFGAVGVTRRW